MIHRAPSPGDSRRDAVPVGRRLVPKKRRWSRSGDRARFAAVVVPTSSSYQFALLVLVILGVIGWQLSAAGPSIAAGDVRARGAIPYLLSHAEMLSGPRLPWDARSSYSPDRCVAVGAT